MKFPAAITLWLLVASTPSSTTAGWIPHSTTPASIGTNGNNPNIMTSSHVNSKTTALFLMPVNSTRSDAGSNTELSSLRGTNGKTKQSWSDLRYRPTRQLYPPKTAAVPQRRVMGSTTSMPVSKMDDDVQAEARNDTASSSPSSSRSYSRTMDQFLQDSFEMQETPQKQESNKADSTMDAYNQALQDLENVNQNPNYSSGQQNATWSQALETSKRKLFDKPRDKNTQHDDDVTQFAKVVRRVTEDDTQETKSTVTSPAAAATKKVDPPVKAVVAKVDTKKIPTKKTDPAISNKKVGIKQELQSVMEPPAKKETATPKKAKDTATRGQGFGKPTTTTTTTTASTTSTTTKKELKTSMASSSNIGTKVAQAFKNATIPTDAAATATDDVVAVDNKKEITKEPAIIVPPTSTTTTTTTTAKKKTMTTPMTDTKETADTKKADPVIAAKASAPTTSNVYMDTKKNAETPISKKEATVATKQEETTKSEVPKKVVAEISATASKTAVSTKKEEESPKAIVTPPPVDTAKPETSATSKKEEAPKAIVTPPPVDIAKPVVTSGTIKKEEPVIKKKEAPKAQVASATPVMETPVIKKQEITTKKGDPKAQVAPPSVEKPVVKKKEEPKTTVTKEVKPKKDDRPAIALENPSVVAKKKEPELKTAVKMPPASSKPMPKMELPKMEVPKIEVPKFEMPKIDVPKFEMPNIDVSKFQAPDMEMPKIKVPKFEMPQFEMPKLEVPKMEVSKDKIDDAVKVTGDKAKAVLDVVANAAKDSVELAVDATKKLNTTTVAGSDTTYEEALDKVATGAKGIFKLVGIVGGIVGDSAGFFASEVTKKAEATTKTTKPTEPLAKAKVKAQQMTPKKQEPVHSKENPKTSTPSLLDSLVGDRAVAEPEPTVAEILVMKDESSVASATVAIEKEEAPAPSAARAVNEKAPPLDTKVHEMKLRLGLLWDNVKYSLKSAADDLEFKAKQTAAAGGDEFELVKFKASSVIEDLMFDATTYFDIMKLELTGKFETTTDRFEDGTTTMETTDAKKSLNVPYFLDVKDE